MSEFSNFLLIWYKENARKLPWREHKDPYAIWISEIMLQQTKVDTVIPYFKKWMTTYKDISKLAAASEEDVLLNWEGLGYYRRAINLLRTARIVDEKYGGSLPGDIDLLKSLPGIGNYTASAIASIAFNKDTPTVDGNIRRIISRVFNIAEQIDLPSTEKLILEHLKEIKPTKNVGDFNQALMDLGATLCSPRNPECYLCPIQSLCLAEKLNNQSDRPVTKKKPTIPTYYFVCALIKKGNEYLIIKRTKEKLLGGLWEFPNAKLDDQETEPVGYLSRKCLEKYGLNIRVGKEIGNYRHTYTHFNQVMNAYLCEVIDQELNSEIIHNWVDINNFSNYPMGKIFKYITKALN